MSFSGTLGNRGCGEVLHHLLSHLQIRVSAAHTSQPTLGGLAHQVFPALLLTSRILILSWARVLIVAFHAIKIFVLAAKSKRKSCHFENLVVASESPPKTSLPNRKFMVENVAGICRESHFLSLRPEHPFRRAVLRI
jgi:hypothetical protein